MYKIRASIFTNWKSRKKLNILSWTLLDATGKFWDNSLRACKSLIGALITFYTACSTKRNVRSSLLHCPLVISLCPHQNYLTSKTRSLLPIVLLNITLLMLLDCHLYSPLAKLNAAPLQPWYARNDSMNSQKRKSIFEIKRCPCLT